MDENKAEADKQTETDSLAHLETRLSSMIT